MKPIFASIILFAACRTHNPLEPGAGDSLGTGTATLLVTGSATAQGRIANALATSDFDTDFSVRVSLNNAAVTTGTVTITSLHAKLNLTFNTNGGNGGRWEGTSNGYEEVYQLDVISGADTVEGVRVDGPDIHSFTAPLAGASLDATLANTVSWSRIQTADEARFHTDAGGGGGGGLTIPDSGTYSMAPGSLKTDTQQARPNTLQLTRTNRVTPTGAAATSEVSVSVVNTIDVVALPCPGC